MNIWAILGIDPTADKAAITAAYRARLTSANPEDDPEAFKQLRAAYEQALKLAKQTQSADNADAGEAERWIAQVDEVYRDIVRRRDPAVWRQLLEADYCAQPVNRLQARDRLLVYLAGHCFVPHSVWLLLEDAFQLRQSAEELRGAFPPAFIDHVVLAGIEQEEQIPYGPLEGAPGADFDGYLRACSQCFRTISDGQAEQAQDLLRQMEETGVQHPYTVLCQARLALLSDRPQEAQAKVDQVLDQMPGDRQALLVDAQLAARREDYARTERDLRQVLAVSPRLAQAKFDLAVCLGRSGRKREGRALFQELLRTLPYNRIVQEALTQIDKELLPEWEARYAECPGDTENATDLAWCYHQLHQEEKAGAVLASLPAELAGTADYENLASKVQLSRGLWEEALGHLRAWEAALRRQEPIDPIRLPESVRLQSCALFSLGRRDEAMALLDRVLEQWPEDNESWKLRAQFRMQLHRLDEALEDIGEYRKRESSDPAGPFLQGEALFAMRRLQDAYNAFQETMELLGGRDAGCVLYQCRILMLANQWDDAKKVLDQLEQAHIKGPAMDYCRGQMANHEHRTKEALEAYQAALPFCRGSNPPDYAGEVFFRLVCLQYDSLDKADLLALVEEGLRADPGSVSLLDLKVDLLRDCDRIPEAIAACRQLCKAAPRHNSAFETLGRLLQFCCRDFAGAAQAYETQLSNRESADVHNLLGLCLQELERFAEAEEQFGRALAMAPNTPAYLANLAELYLLQKKYTQAESTFRAALSLPNPRARDRVQLRHRLALLLRRKGDWEGAAEVLQGNIQSEYEYEDYRTLAELWAQAGQPGRALQALQEWQRLTAPQEAAWLREKASILRQTSREGAVLRALQLGAQTSRDCRMALGDLYAARGQYQAAIGLFRQLALDLPGEDDVLDRLAKCLLWSGDRAGAAETAKKGLELLERNRSRYNKAMFYTRQAGFCIEAGELERARALLEQAEAAPLCRFCAYPACKDAIGLRVMLLEEAGQLEEAAALCREAGRKYPDEADFHAYERRIRKRMGQKYDRGN